MREAPRSILGFSMFCFAVFLLFFEKSFHLTIRMSTSELAIERERERERESDGTGFLFEEPNPTGSRPSDLIGLYRKWQRAKRPQPAKSERDEMMM